MLDQTTFFLVRIIHIIGFTIGFASSFSSLLMYLIGRKNRKLSNIIQIIIALLLIQFFTNILSLFSGLIRLEYSTVLSNTSKTPFFYTKMFFYGGSILTLLITLIWFRKIFRLLISQKINNVTISNRQELISILLLILNAFLFSMTFILGGILSLLN